MAKPEAEKEAEKVRAIVHKKLQTLKSRLIEEFPNDYKEAANFFGEVQRLWVKLSPFVGEEEAYGVSSMFIGNDQQIRNQPLDFILWTALFRMMSDKFDQELKWFRDNRQILEMMVKEYLAQVEHR